MILTIRIFDEYVATSAQVTGIFLDDKAEINYVKLSINLTIRLIQTTGRFVNPSNPSDIRLLA